jgi:hypothetical protein
MIMVTVFWLLCALALLLSVQKVQAGAHVEQRSCQDTCMSGYSEPGPDLTSCLERCK